MYNFRRSLLKEQAYLEEVLSRTDNDSAEVQQGSLQSSISHGCRQYYRYIKDGNPKRVYIPLKEEELIHSLAQKGYNLEVSSLAEKRLRQVKEILNSYSDDEIENIYTSQPAYKQDLITPVYPIWEEHVKQWLSIPYQQKGFSPKDPIIEAANGMRIRSKSEQAIANYLLDKNIPFKYECPLYLTNYGFVYPDFTFLSRRIGKEIYWEHEGRMDDPAYVQRQIDKIESYESDNIYPGERLILTFETAKKAINNQQIERMVKRYIL